MNDQPSKPHSGMSHDRGWELLPWLVNGTLSSDQADGVARHVAACEVCATEIQALQNLQEKMRNGDAVLLAPQTAWQKMVERLDREEELLTGHDAGIGRRGAQTLRANRSYWPTKWQAVAATQAVAILGLVATLVWQARTATNSATNLAADAHAPAQYATLTATADAAIDTAATTTLRVVFHRDTPHVEINALLRALPAQIVAGPSEAGVYTLALTASETLPTLLTQLRGDTRVVFVEPSVAAR